MNQRNLVAGDERLHNGPLSDMELVEWAASLYLRQAKNFGLSSPMPIVAADLHGLPLPPGARLVLHDHVFPMVEPELRKVQIIDITGPVREYYWVGDKLIGTDPIPHPPIIETVIPQAEAKDLITEVEAAAAGLSGAVRKTQRGRIVRFMPIRTLGQKGPSHAAERRLVEPSAKPSCPLDQP